MNFEDFDLRLLKVFDALSAEGSVTRAAARLHMTQSATSQALAKLRKTVGDPLFVKVGRSMNPTAKAVAMCGPIRQSLQMISSALDDSITFDPMRTRQRFRIATTDHILTILLPSLAKRIEATALAVQLIAASIDLDRGFDQLREGQIDLLIARFVVTKVPANFRTRPLLPDSHIVLMRRGHVRFKSRLSLAAYGEADHIVVAPRGSWLPGPVDRALAQVGLRRNIRMMVPHYSVVPHVVANTDFVATVPSLALSQEARYLPIQTLPPPLDIPQIKIEMAWNERHQHDPAHKWLRNAITDVFKT